MTMSYKNIFHTVLLIVAAATVNTACTFEQEDFFDESASLRITHLNEKLQTRLVNQSAEGQNGWVIQYFVAGTDDYDFEGFNLFGRFYDNGKVTLASNHRYLRNGNANKYTEHTSGYQMLAEEGPVLAFNTWNNILTVFVDPVDPSKAPNSIINDGEGMNGDNNLVLKALNDADILFRGERHQAEVRFVPCDRPWEDYIAATAELKNKIATSTLTSYYVINGTDTMYFNGLNRGVFIYGERVNDPLNKKTLSCVFTPKGFRINHVDSLGENAFQEFTLTEDETKLLSEDGQTQVIACWDNYIINHTAVWKMDASLFSAEQQTLFDRIDAAFKAYNSNCSLESIGLGKSSGGNAVQGLILTFYTNAAKTKTNSAGLALTYSKPAFGQMQIVSNAENAMDKNLSTISANSPDLEALVRSFAATLNGVYDITPNNYFLPTGGTFTAVGGGTTFKLN